MLSFFFNAFFNCVVLSLIFSRGSSVLLFVVLIIMTFMNSIYFFEWLVISVIFMRVVVHDVFIFFSMKNSMVESIMVEWFVMEVMPLMMAFKILVIIFDAIKLLRYETSESFLWNLVMRGCVIVMMAMRTVFNSRWYVNIMSQWMSVRVMSVYEMISVFIVDWMMCMLKISFVKISELVMCNFMSFFIKDFVRS